MDQDENKISNVHTSYKLALGIICNCIYIWIYFSAIHSQETRPVTSDVRWYLGHSLFISMLLFIPFSYGLYFYLSKIGEFIKIQKVYRHKLIVIYPLSLIYVIYLYIKTF